MAKFIQLRTLQTKSVISINPDMISSIYSIEHEDQNYTRVNILGVKDHHVLESHEEILLLIGESDAPNQ